MAEDILQKLIRQAETLTPDEQLHLATHLEKMARQVDPSVIVRSRWAKIQAHKQEILELAAKYGASNVRVFGLGKQDEAVTEIEVDFIVNLEAGRSLLDQSGLMVALQDLLGFEVYVTEEGGLKDDYRERVLKKAIPL